MRHFVRLDGELSETDPDPEYDPYLEICSEGEVNHALSLGQNPDKFRELVPIKTDTRQVKQLVVI